MTFDACSQKIAALRRLRKNRPPTGWGCSLFKNQMTKLDIEGLPNGYAGLLIVVPPNFEPGTYPPMNELIAPSSTAYGGESDTAWAFVWPIDKQYKCCGWFSFCCLKDKVIPDNADVDPEHQRRGIASSVYRFVSLATNLELTPGFDQTEDAVEFWKSLSKFIPNHL